ncbi:MAG TPA: pitrilysin family protein [Thermoplasmata archaeon]|nr:pitrilysin family protein [Thermoplasmata archaeon]
MVRRVTARPPLRRFRLRNGLHVVLAPQPASPTASVWVWYRVGSKNEWPGVTGASHWIEHMVFEGSPRYGKGEMDRAIVRVGGSLNAFTDTDYTVYFSTVPREHLAVPLDIESDRMTRALLLDGEVERERTIIHSEREGNENWPEFRVEEELLQLGFRVHPYRWDALGSRADIERLTPQELRDYYHRFYGPRNAVLVVAGGFAPVAAERTIRGRFSRLASAGDDVTVHVREPEPHGERRAELGGPGTTPYLQVAWRGPALRDPGTPSTLVLDAVLGGAVPLFAPGFRSRGPGEHPSSRLHRALIDPGLAVRAGTSWQPREYPSLFGIYALAAPGTRLDRLEERIDSVVAGLCRAGPTPTEIEDVRARIRRGAALVYEGASHTGYRLGYFATVARPEYEDELLRALLRVRAADVRERARALFRNDARLVVRYTPTDGGVDG